MKDNIENLLNLIDNVKTKLTDNEYKNIVDSINHLYHLNTQSDKQKALLLSKYDNLKCDYIQLNKRFLQLYDEYKGFDIYENNNNNTIDIEWRNFLVSHSI